MRIAAFNFLEVKTLPMVLAIVGLFSGLGCEGVSSEANLLKDASPADNVREDASPGGNVLESSVDNLVWMENDGEIQIHRFSYWDGGARVLATRDQLSEEQLELLSRLSLTDNNGECMEDVPGFRISIIGNDGEVTEYQAGYEDSVCNGPDRLISMAAMDQLWATFSCLSASQTRGGSNTIEDALTIEVDPACHHGFFGGPIWIRVNIDQPGRYLFRESTFDEKCTPNEVTLALYDETGETLLYEGAHNDATDCWSLDHQIEDTGIYFLLINGIMGDYFVNISRD